MDFTEFIQDHAPGRSEAGRLLGKLVDAVRDTGKPGTLTFTVKIDVDKAQPNTGLLISDEVAAKLPKHERPVRKAWMLPSGQVVDYDPDAPPMPGMAVDGAGKLVDLDAEELQASAAHFLQHTTGVFTGLQVVPDAVDDEDLPVVDMSGHTPGDPLPVVDMSAGVSPAEDAADEEAAAVAEEMAAAAGYPGAGEDEGPAAVLETVGVSGTEFGTGPAEEEGPADFDPRNPFALADTAPPARSAGLTDPPEKKARAPRKPRTAAAK